MFKQYSLLLLCFFAISIFSGCNEKTTAKESPLEKTTIETTKKIDEQTSDTPIEELNVQEDNLENEVAIEAEDSSADTAEIGPIATISTSLGDIKLKFYSDVAPKHVENFMSLALSGFYNGTIFHRVIPGFMIQGGDPNTKDLNNKSRYGQGGPGHNVKAEFNDISHKRGILSMARSGHPDSAGSQFFIVVQDSTFLDGQYTVFGEVIEGMDVADKIVSQKRDARDNPLERIEMKVSIQP